MKKNVACFLLTLSLLAGCQCRQGSAPPSSEPEVEEPVPAPEPKEKEPFPVPAPVFSSEPVPEAVAARMRGVSYPEGAQIKLSDLRYLRISHVDFDGCDQVGELVCNKAIADDLVAIFRDLYEARYPIRSIRLIDDFGGDDEASMAADNTSCFNYRTKTGMRSLSKHALGLAIDINPFENPYVRDSRVRPAGADAFADRSKDFPHKIDRSDLCYRLFRDRGFAWGGAWRSVRDYQHFEK